VSWRGAAVTLHDSGKPQEPEHHQESDDTEYDSADD
jgi:hypothetical protein